uniref:Uncharacterized protein n=1 Tax=Anguilla anguilla TaxID=7936 RepID=A0A0E9RXD8_ANGAN
MDLLSRLGSLSCRITQLRLASAQEKTTRHSP